MLLKRIGSHTLVSDLGFSLLAISSVMSYLLMVRPLVFGSKIKIQGINFIPNKDNGGESIDQYPHQICA